MLTGMVTRANGRNRRLATSTGAPTCGRKRRSRSPAGSGWSAGRRARSRRSSRPRRNATRSRASTARSMVPPWPPKFHDIVRSAATRSLASTSTPNAALARPGDGFGIERQARPAGQRRSWRTAARALAEERDLHPRRRRAGVGDGQQRDDARDGSGLPRSKRLKVAVGCVPVRELVDVGAPSPSGSTPRVARVRRIEAIPHLPLVRHAVAVGVGGTSRRRRHGSRQVRAGEGRLAGGPGC